MRTSDHDNVAISEGLNGVVAFTVNGQYFGFFTDNG